MILLTYTCDALWVWHIVQDPATRLNRTSRYKPTLHPGGYWGGQAGIMCSVFRNEGSLRSSDLILEAEDRQRLQEFMAPFAQMGNVEVLPASSCEAVVKRGKC